MRLVRFIDEWVSAAHCWASQTVAPGMASLQLPTEAEAEAEDLEVVEVGVVDGPGKVERDRSRSHGRDGHP